MPEHIYIRLFQMLLEELERVEQRIVLNAVDKHKAIPVFFELNQNAIDMCDRISNALKGDRARIKSQLDAEVHNRK